MQKAEELFERVEILVDNDKILERVRIARMPIEYVKLSTIPKNYSYRDKLIKNFFDKLNIYLGFPTLQYEFI